MPQRKPFDLILSMQLPTRERGMPSLVLGTSRVLSRLMNGRFSLTLTILLPTEVVGTFSVFTIGAMKKRLPPMKRPFDLIPTLLMLITGNPEHFNFLEDWKKLKSLMKKHDNLATADSILLRTTRAITVNECALPKARN